MAYTGIDVDDPETDWNYASPFDVPTKRKSRVLDLNPAHGVMRGGGASGNFDNPLTQRKLDDPSVAASGISGLGANQSAPSVNEDTTGPGRAAAQVMGGLQRRMPPPGSEIAQAAPPSQMPPPMPPGAGAPPQAQPTPPPSTASKLNPAIQQAAETLAQPLPQKQSGAKGVMQRLGMALLSATKLAPMAQQIIYPEYSREMAQRAQAEETLKSLSGAQEQMQRGQWYEAQAQEGKGRYLRVGTGVFDQQTGQWVTMPMDKSNLVSIDPKLAKERGLAPMDDGTFRVPATVAAQFVKPGKEAGGMYVTEEVGKRLGIEPEDGMYYLPPQGIGPHVTNTEKPAPRSPVEQQFIDEYLQTHPGSKIADAVAAYAKTTQKPEQPPQALMIGPDGRAINIRPGTQVPQGAVTPSGESTQNVPTAATRAMAEKAPRVLHFIQRMNQLLDENEKKLGPLQSRWSEFTAGRVGLPNRGYAQLRTDAGLLETALMNMHVGARGGEKIMEHFRDLIGMAHQSPENLRAALGEIKAYAEQVATEGHRNPQGSAPAGGRPSLDQIFNK